MNRDQKAATIEEIAAQIQGAEAIFAVDYRGISVPQAAELRGKLRDADASFRIVKNRLTKIAAERSGEERLAELLEGPTALTFVRGDTAMAAKAISSFTKEHEVLVFKGGFMADLDLDEDRFKSIAKLPGREVLDGQLAGVVASPLTGLVRGLGSMIQGLAVQLGQIAEQGLVSGEAPVKDDASDAAPADAPAEDDASDAAPAGPGAEDDSSSSQAAGEEPPSPPPAEEASGDSSSEASASDEADGDSAAEAPAGEGEADSAEASTAGENAGDEGGDEKTSDDDDTSEEEE